jgi:hypothetical protein
MPYGRSRWIYTKSFLNGKLDLSGRKQWPIWSPPIMKLRTKLPCNKCAGILQWNRQIARVIKFRFTYRIGAGLCGRRCRICRPYQFHELLNRIEFVLKRLIDSFAVGNVIKKRYSCSHCWWTQCGKIDLIECVIKWGTRYRFEVAGTTRDTIEESWSSAALVFGL